LLVDGVLYGSTSLGQAMAIDAGTGETLWSYSSEAYRTGRPPNLGYISRGVGYWADGDDRRILHDILGLAVSHDAGGNLEQAVPDSLDHLTDRVRIRHRMGRILVTFKRVHLSYT
jgi:hypothetical protein